MGRFIKLTADDGQPFLLDHWEIEAITLEDRPIITTTNGSYQVTESVEQILAAIEAAEGGEERAGEPKPEPIPLRPGQVWAGPQGEAWIGEVWTGRNGRELVMVDTGPILAGGPLGRAEVWSVADFRRAYPTFKAAKIVGPLGNWAAEPDTESEPEAEPKPEHVPLRPRQKWTGPRSTVVIQHVAEGKVYYSTEVFPDYLEIRGSDSEADFRAKWPTLISESPEPATEPEPKTEAQPEPAPEPEPQPEPHPLRRGQKWAAREEGTRYPTATIKRIDGDRVYCSGQSPDGIAWSGTYSESTVRACWPILVAEPEPTNEPEPKTEAQPEPEPEPMREADLVARLVARENVLVARVPDGLDLPEQAGMYLVHMERADRWFGRIGIARTAPVRNMDLAASMLVDLANRLGYRPVEANS